MVRVRQKQLPLHSKKVPVVSPLRGNLLKWLKARAIPLVNLGSHVFHSLHDHSLSKSQKMSISDGKMPPLLGRNGGNTLKFLKTVSPPFVDDRINGELIRALPRTDACNRQEVPLSQRKKLRIFPPRGGETLLLDIRVGRAPIEQHRGIAISSIHIRLGLWEVFRQLWNCQIGLPLQDKSLDSTSA